MSANTIWRSAPVSVLAAFALGAAAAAGCGAALAALMASRGMSPGTAWPFATASVCVGSLLGGWVLALLQKSRGLLWGGGLGLAYALALLGFQLAGGRRPGRRAAGAAGSGGPVRRCRRLRRGPPHRKAPPPLTGRRPNGTGAVRYAGPQAASEKLQQSLFGCDPIRRTSYVGLSGARLIQNPCRAAGCAPLRQTQPGRTPRLLSLLSKKRPGLLLFLPSRRLSAGPLCAGPGGADRTLPGNAPSWRLRICSGPCSRRCAGPGFRGRAGVPVRLSRQLVPPFHPGRAGRCLDSVRRGISDCRRQRHPSAPAGSVGLRPRDDPPLCDAVRHRGRGGQSAAVFGRRAGVMPCWGWSCPELPLRGGGRALPVWGVGPSGQRPAAAGRVWPAGAPIPGRGPGAAGAVPGAERLVPCPSAGCPRRWPAWPGSCCRDYPRRSGRRKGGRTVRSVRAV